MSKTMKENIEFLKRDRSASSEVFQKKLEAIGLKIFYGEFGYWENEPYVKIGDERVYLVQACCEYDNTYIGWRKQNDVISEIKNAIKREVINEQAADENVQRFFEAILKYKEGIQCKDGRVSD